MTNINPILYGVLTLIYPIALFPCAAQDIPPYTNPNDDDHSDFHFDYF